MKHNIEPQTRCDTCGMKISLIWGGEDIKWTGKCDWCEDIVQFVTKDELL